MKVVLETLQQRLNALSIGQKTKIGQYSGMVPIQKIFQRKESFKTMDRPISQIIFSRKFKIGTNYQKFQLKKLEDPKRIQLCKDQIGLEDKKLKQNKFQNTQTTLKIVWVLWLLGKCNLEKKKERKKACLMKKCLVIVPAIQLFKKDLNLFKDLLQLKAHLPPAISQSHLQISRCQNLQVFFMLLHLKSDKNKLK